MVLGEFTHSRVQARSSQKWYLGSEVVEEVDEVHHLGILRSVSFSFFLTFYTLYSILCLPTWL